MMPKCKSFPTLLQTPSREQLWTASYWSLNLLKVSMNQSSQCNCSVSFLFTGCGSEEGCLSQPLSDIQPEPLHPLCHCGPASPHCDTLVNLFWSPPPPPSSNLPQAHSSLMKGIPLFQELLDSQFSFCSLGSPPSTTPLIHHQQSCEHPCGSSCSVTHCSPKDQPSTVQVMSERSSMESVKESLKLTFLSLGVKLNSLRLTRRGGGKT